MVWLRPLASAGKGLRRKVWNPGHSPPSELDSLHTRQVQMWDRLPTKGKCLSVRPAKDQSRDEIIKHLRAIGYSDPSMVHPRSGWLSPLLFHLQERDCLFRHGSSGLR